MLVGSRQRPTASTTTTPRCSRWSPTARPWRSATPASTSASTGWSRRSSARFCPRGSRACPGSRSPPAIQPGGADVGGDWYDAIELDGGGVGIAMGDVVGPRDRGRIAHGRAPQRACAPTRSRGTSPAKVLAKLDRLMSQTGPRATWRRCSTPSSTRTGRACASRAPAIRRRCCSARTAGPSTSGTAARRRSGWAARGLRRRARPTLDARLDPGALHGRPGRGARGDAHGRARPPEGGGRRAARRSPRRSAPT